MATFIVLCAFQQMDVDGLTENVELEARARRAVSDAGGELRDIWLCTGEYDLVAVVDAAEASSAIAFLAALSARASVRTTTLTAAGDIGGVSDAHRNWGSGN
jgi:uncharacterized protein with GYD domain